MTEKARLWDPGMDLGAVEGPRRKVILNDEHLAVARIHYPPGDSNEFHHHEGTSQALYVIKGTFTVRTEHADGSVTERICREGDVALVGDRERERFLNTGDEPAFVLQVLRPGAPVVRDEGSSYRG